MHALARVIRVLHLIHRFRAPRAALQGERAPAEARPVADPVGQSILLDRTKQLAFRAAASLKRLWAPVVSRNT